MEYAFKAHKIADEDKVVNAALCLKGEASEWLMGLTRKRGEEPFANWSDFESGIKKRFEPANLQTRLQLQLHEIKQTATLEEYIRRFQNLVMQVDDLPELTKVTHFMCGLKTDLRRELRKQGPQTLEAAIRLAVDTRDSLMDDAPRGTSPRDSAGSHLSTAMEIDSLEYRSRNRDPDPRQCFNCRRFGHISRYCPRARRTGDRGRRFVPRSNRPRFHALEAGPRKEERQ